MSVEEAVWYVATAYAVVLAGLLALFAYGAWRAERLARQVRELRREVDGEVDGPIGDRSADWR